MFDEYREADPFNAVTPAARQSFGESGPGSAALRWRKSSWSAHNGNCVEVARLADGFAVRDSMDNSGTVLIFKREEWGVFLDGISQSPNLA
jgi:hypothetical protein